MRNNQIPQINPAQLLAQYQNPGESLRGIGKNLGAQADSMETQRLREIELAKQEARQKMLDDRQKLRDDRQEARQVILDDRASKEYDYKLTERAKAEEEAKQKQSYLNALSSPGDMFESKAVQEKLMSPGAMAQMVANNPVLTKANEQGIESLTPQEKVQYENHFKQMDRLGAMPTKRMEILDAADLYGVLGGEYATTQSTEAKKALELARNTGLAEVNKQRTEMSIAQLKEARSEAQRDSLSSEYAGSKNAFGVKVVSPIDVMKDAQAYHEKAYAEDGKGGKLAKPINTLTQLMANNGYDAAQINAIVDESYKPSTKWGYGLFGKDAELKIPTVSELNSWVGAPRNVATSTGYSVSDRAYDKQVAEISKKYLDEAQSKIENRGVHKPTEELFNRIMNNIYGNEPKTTESKTTEKTPSIEKDIIPKPTKVGGLIGAAINTKGKGNELATLTVENPQEFAREYELLKPAEKARVDGILGSDASNKYFNSIKEITEKSRKAEVDIEKAKKGDGTISTEELKKILEQEEQSYRSNAPKTLFNNPSTTNSEQPWWNKNVNVGKLIADTAVNTVKGLGNLRNSIPELYKNIDEFQGRINKGGEDLISRGITSFGENSKEEILAQNTLNRKVNNLSSSAKEKFSANLEKLTKKYNGTKSKSEIIQEALDEVNK